MKSICLFFQDLKVFFLRVSYGGVGFGIAVKSMFSIVVVSIISQDDLTFTVSVDLNDNDDRVILASI